MMLHFFPLPLPPLVVVVVLWFCLFTHSLLVDCRGYARGVWVYLDKNNCCTPL